MNAIRRYDESSIVTLKGLDAVRNRPTQFLNSTGIEGLIHQALELITNAIDEIALMFEQGKLTILICIDSERSTYQVVVIDNGRGLPLERLRDSYTELNTSGKFNTSAYEHSGGLFGVGAKVSVGTAIEFKGISHRPEATAALRVTDGKVDPKIETIQGASAQTGVTVLYEPNKSIFTEIDTFAEVGVPQLLTLIQKWCFFKHLDIELRVHPLGLPQNIWKMNIPKTEAVIQKYVNDAHLVFSERTFDRVQWLRSYWNISRPFAHQITLSDTFPSQDKHGDAITIRYELRLYHVKFDSMGGRFGMVNNVAIDDFKSTHILSVMDVLKLTMAPMIKDPAVRKFFIDQYRLPLYIAIDMKCPGAEFAGTLKNAFFSRALRLVYEPSLKERFSSGEGLSFVETVYQELATDIEAKYILAATGVPKVKNNHRLFEALHYGDKNYFPCKAPPGTPGTELFLVEGKSAGANAAPERNADLQGVYGLRGKPFNGVIDRDHAQQSAITIRKHPIYEDIVTILGLNPAKFDPTTLSYQCLGILTDGDDHGYHISSLTVGNLYVLCPDMVESGMIHIITPPLYSLEYKARKVPRIYLRNDEHLKVWMATEVYMRALNFGVRVKGHTEKTHYLQGKECVNFLRTILEIGEAITNLSGELVIDSFIIERLSHVTAYLYRNEDGVLDTNRIKELMQMDKVVYHPDGHVLVVTHGRDDHVIPLQNVLERLVQVVTPLLNLIHWRTTQIYITNKHQPIQFNDQPISITDLYDLLKRFDNEFIIERYKGLGSMPGEDVARTCMDPKLRNMFTVTTVGDVDVIFNLLGKDSAPRKALTRRS